MKITVPIKLVGSERWGALAFLAETHEICGEKVDCVEQKFSFAGQHRVRLYRFKKNVYWRIPFGVEVDITQVPAAENAAPSTRRHHK